MRKITKDSAKPGMCREDLSKKKPFSTLDIDNVLERREIITLEDRNQRPTPK
jgi:hypothetical protein